MSKSIKKDKKQQLIFYIVLMIFPIVQFSIMYIGVNAKLIVLAFQKYSFLDGYSWVGIDNIKAVFNDVINNGTVSKSIINSLIYFLIQIPFNTFLSILFSFYIFKKCFGNNFFKVMLFMPTIISSVVMVLLFKYFSESAIPEIVKLLTGKKIMGLLQNENTSFGTIVFYNILCGFGTNILLYTGSMASISESIIESSEVDGASGFKELFYIVLPMIYSTITTLFIANMATIFTHQLNVYTLFGFSAEIRNYNMGYFLFRGTSNAQLSEYPYYSAMGFILTLVVGPLVILTRKVMFKFDALRTA